MTVGPSQKPQWPRGPTNELHHAAKVGSIACTVALLAGGSIDINQGNLEGRTPLMNASFHGHSCVVRILLNKGAAVSIADTSGFTAVHISAFQGHLEVAKMLVSAGSDLQVSTFAGSTPLHLAAQEGHSQITSMLIEAGANVNPRMLDGSTPLFLAAAEDRLDAVKVLLRAKADPLLAMTSPSGTLFPPLDAAAERGHPNVVRELIRQLGIAGCGGASGGVDALCHASRGQHLETMAVLTRAGVVDTKAMALIAATACGRFASTKYLLQHHAGKTSGGIGTYVSARGVSGMTPLICGIGCPSPRIVRLLADVGADATSVVQMKAKDGKQVVFNDTPLELAIRCLREKKSVGNLESDTDQEVNRMEAVRRLLLQVEAVHAISWLWHSAEVPPTARAAEESSSNGSPNTPAAAEGKRIASTPVTSMLPILRRRARRPRVLLAALSRYSAKA